MYVSMFFFHLDSGPEENHNIMAADMGSDSIPDLLEDPTRDIRSKRQKQRKTLILAADVNAMPCHEHLQCMPVMETNIGVFLVYMSLGWDPPPPQKIAIEFQLYNGACIV